MSTKKIHFLFPSEPYLPKNVDMEYENEFNVAKSLGFSASLLDIEALEDGRTTFNRRPESLNEEDTMFIYRGWMLRETQYQTLEKFFSTVNASLLIDKETYLKSHYLPGWYNSIEKLTIPTIFSNSDDLEKDLVSNNITSCFIKDYVKSLTTERGSICQNIEEAKEVVKLIYQYRGFIEGGICIRELISIKPNTEERYFVFRGKTYARKGKKLPSIVEEAAKLHKSPFFSVDVVEKTDGNLVIVEIGDGQVSDLKLWSNDDITHFFKIFTI